MTKSSKDTTIEELWDAAVDKLPDFSPDEERAGLVLLNELTGGEPVTASRLARALGASVDQAEHYLQDSGFSPLVYRDEQGSAIGFFGLSTVSTDHRFAVNGRTLWAWCAADTLFLPELLGTTAKVESKDPETAETIRLTVSPTAVESSQPDGLLVSMNSPETWETTSAVRIVATACHYIHFFGSAESGERWTSNHPNTVLVPLEEAFVYARRQNARMFGHELAREA